MKIGLIDVDGHNFPNLALMRISAYHKAQGDDVEWWWSDFIHYDIVYMSKIFSDAYSKDKPEPMNADKVIKGGSGYCIRLKDGKEFFDRSLNHQLPDEVEKMFPDYSIYPQYKFAIAMTSRGCSRGCPYCHVYAKEGPPHKVADVWDFYAGQDEIVSLDPNITALPRHDKHELFRQYAETGAKINFCQGLDIRLLTDQDIDLLNSMKLKRAHFAWDDPEDDLKESFVRYAKSAKKKDHGRFGTVYILTGFNSTMEQNLHRIYTVRDLGFDPYVMVYNKPNADPELKKLQRWCNNKLIFNSVAKFEDYDPKRG